MERRTYSGRRSGSTAGVAMAIHRPTPETSLSPTRPPTANGRVRLVLLPLLVGGIHSREPHGQGTALVDPMNPVQAGQS
jgi:hypothetical protein